VPQASNGAVEPMRDQGAGVTDAVGSNSKDVSLLCSGRLRAR
jgi:hypothetical protein